MFFEVQTSNVWTTSFDLLQPAVLRHIGSNDITLYKQHDLNVTDVVQRVIYIGLHCREYGVKDIIILSVLIKRSVHLTRIIQQRNGLLSEYCVSNNSHYLTNNSKSKQNLMKDGIHLNNVGGHPYMTFPQNLQILILPLPLSRYVLNVSPPSNRMALIATTPYPPNRKDFLLLKPQFARKFTEC